MKVTNVFVKGNLYGFLMAIMSLCLAACGDKDLDEGPVAYDPSKPVTISHFFPTEGGALDDLIIYGENFGTDKNAVNVTIGDKKAVVVSVAVDKIYCFVPSSAFTGEIVVTVTTISPVKALAR